MTKQSCTRYIEKHQDAIKKWAFKGVTWCIINNHPLPPWNYDIADDYQLNHWSDAEIIEFGIFLGLGTNEINQDSLISESRRIRLLINQMVWTKFDYQSRESDIKKALSNSTDRLTHSCWKYDDKIDATSSETVQYEVSEYDDAYSPTWQRIYGLIGNADQMVIQQMLRHKQETMLLPTEHQRWHYRMQNALTFEM